jgi:hypothetical protein
MCLNNHYNDPSGAVVNIADCNGGTDEIWFPPS